MSLLKAKEQWVQRGLWLCLYVAGAALGRAQTADHSAQDAAAQVIAAQRIELAAQELQKVKSLVEIGAEARVQLERAEDNLADARDVALLEQTRYAPITELNDDLMNEAVAAGERRVARAQQRIEISAKLRADGFASSSDFAALEQELINRQSDLDWARSRSRFKTEAAALAAFSASIASSLNSSTTEDQGAVSRIVEQYEGAAGFDEARDLNPLSAAFATEFERPLPVSADGATPLHRSWGFDHRGRVDVAVNPGDPEGIWLRHYLQSRRIPYYSFTRAVPGKATAAHIHIGPPSPPIGSSE